MYDASVELLIDVLTNHSNFLTASQYDQLEEILCGPWAASRLDALVQGDFEFDSFQFGQLLLAFGFAKVETLVRSTEPRDQCFLQMLRRLLTANGYPVFEDKVFVPAVEFWSTFAEIITDLMYSDDEGTASWIETAMSHVLDAVSHAWKKIVYPPSSDFSQWDSTERTGFHDARKDVVDLLESTFTVAGPRLITTFAELLLAALSSSTWLHLEAAAYCLGGLADCVKDDDRCDKALTMVFSSQLFSNLQSNSAAIPLRVRQTCVSLIENYTTFFERHVHLLPPALNLLFSGLGDPSMASPASKSILRLCSSCRHHLHTEVNAFLTEYQQLASRKCLDCLSSERVLGAIACIAQAAPDPNYRHAACAQILSLIQGDVHISIDLVQSSSVLAIPCQQSPRCFDETLGESTALHTGLRSLRCLVAVARSFQSPDDLVVDIISEKDHDQFDVHNLDGDSSRHQLQKQIIDIIVSVQRAFASSAEVVELICSVLRCGFSETEPGPFVLPPNDVAHYITGHGIETPRIGILVRTASSFISSLQSHNLLGRQELLNAVLLWTIGLTKLLSST